MVTNISKYPLLKRANSLEEIYIACDLYGLDHPIISDELLYTVGAQDMAYLIMFIFEHIAKINNIDLELYKE